MSIGDTILDDGQEFEVVWSGGPLLADRDSKPLDSSSPAKRLYNKTSDYWLKYEEVDDPSDSLLEDTDVVDESV